MGFIKDKNNLLLNAYSADNFKKDAQQIIELIADELKDMQESTEHKTIDRKAPQEQLSFWSDELVSKEPCNLSGLSKKRFTDTAGSANMISTWS